MGIVVWLLIGAAVAAVFAPSTRYAFPTGRPACVIGGMAGGFLGGGTFAVATGSNQTCVDAGSTGAATCGALVVVAAVAWAGRTERPPS